MEFVFVVPRKDLFPTCFPHGMVAFQAAQVGNPGASEGSELSRRSFEERALEHGFFVEREYAERSPHLKQIIPYAMVCVGDDVLMVERTKKGGESRLHNKLSIGIGGHINPVDAEVEAVEHLAAGGPNNLFTAATARELTEELTLEGDFRATSVGIVNDDTNPVGAVHVGLVQVIQVRGSVEVRETEQLVGRLVAPSELRSLRSAGANFETWSSLLVDSLDELLPHSSVSLA